MADAAAGLDGLLRMGNDIHDVVDIIADEKRSASLDSRACQRFWLSSYFQPGFHIQHHFTSAAERAVCASRIDIGHSLRELGINEAALVR
jgi:hypothetical protein